VYCVALPASRAALHTGLWQHSHVHAESADTCVAVTDFPLYVSVVRVAGILSAVHPVLRFACAVPVIQNHSFFAPSDYRFAILPFFRSLKNHSYEACAFPPAEDVLTGLFLRTFPESIVNECLWSYQPQVCKS
jgi:hypothetical protein